MANGFLGSGFGETVPRGILSNVLATQPKRVRDFFGPRFNELFSEFQGSLAQNPRQSFGGFLGNLGTKFGTYSPLQRRDFSASTLTPRTRFLNF